jgi:hypothetical protein
MKYILTIELEEDDNKTLARMFLDWAKQLAEGDNIRRWGKVSADGKIKIEVEREGTKQGDCTPN